MCPAVLKTSLSSGQNKGGILIFPFFAGTVVLRADGVKAETLINHLRKDIPLRGIRKNGERSLRFEIMCRHKQTVLERIAKLSTEAVVSVEHESGFPVIIRHIKKRFGLFIGAFWAIIMVFASSKMIWLVSVEGNETVESVEIERLMKTLGIAEGRPKKVKDIEYLYNTFLLTEKRISWLSVNYDGMIAHVEVKETEKPEKKIDKTQITNLVASCDGVIKRVDALDGSAAVAPGETVCKGELLISAFVETRETGTVLRTARGSVWASTVHTYEISVPKKKAQKKYTGKEDTRRTLCILGQNLPLSLPNLYTGDAYDKSYQKEPFVLFGFVRLPFEILTETAKVYRFEQQPRTKENAAAEAAAELMKRIDSDLARAEILKREEGISETEDSYIFTYELSCLENIALPVLMEFEE